MADVKFVVYLTADNPAQGELAGDIVAWGEMSDEQDFSDLEPNEAALTGVTDDPDPRLYKVQGGALVARTPAEIDNYDYRTTEADYRTLVEAERDRRIRENFFWNGKQIILDDTVMRQIAADAMEAAVFIDGDPALVFGAGWSWESGAAVIDFADGTSQPLTAHQAIDLHRAVRTWERLHYEAARALRAATPTTNYTSGLHWPS